MDDDQAPTPDDTAEVDDMVQVAEAAQITTTPVSTGAGASPLDLVAVARDLADVEIALARLEVGTYFTDEVTGQPLPEAFLIAHPTARTVASAPTA